MPGLARNVAGTAALVRLAHGVRTDDLAGAFERAVGAAFVQIPATWVLVGIVAALFGLNQVVLDISPYAHVPKLPGGALTVTPLVWLTVVAAAPTAAGLVGFRRRDTQPA
ncbi:hypothetical protein [Flindersiella endophytica]